MSTSTNVNVSAPIPTNEARADHETEHANAVRQMFDRIAPTYDTLNHLMSAGIDVRWRKQAVRALRGAPEGAVLDSCAGTMDLAAMLADEFPRERIVASDFAAEMLERGKHKAPRVERVVADATKMPFSSGEFTKMTCGFGMRNLASTEAGAREALRVLAPRGVFVTLEFFRPERARTRAFHAAYARVVLPTAGAIVSGDREAYAYLAESMKGFLTRDEYARLLMRVGFTRVTSTDLLLGIASIVRAEAPALAAASPTVSSDDSKGVK